MPPKSDGGGKDDGRETIINCIHLMELRKETIPDDPVSKSISGSPMMIALVVRIMISTNPAGAYMCCRSTVGSKPCERPEVIKAFNSLPPGLSVEEAKELLMKLSRGSRFNKPIKKTEKPDPFSEHLRRIEKRRQQQA